VKERENDKNGLSQIDQNRSRIRTSSSGWRNGDAGDGDPPVGVMPIQQTDVTALWSRGLWPLHAQDAQNLGPIRKSIECFRITAWGQNQR
jgi:hypothetical protein